MRNERERKNDELYDSIGKMYIWSFMLSFSAFSIFPVRRGLDLKSPPLSYASEFVCTPRQFATLLLKYERISHQILRKYFVTLLCKENKGKLYLQTIMKTA